MPRAHAKLSASSSARWWNCPGSVRLCEGIPDVTSEYAAEGSAAHALAETCLKKGTNSTDHLGEIFNVGTYRFEVTDEMAEAVQIYLDFVRPFMDAGEFEIEAKLDLSLVYPDMFGTGDFVVYEEKKKHLTIIDYKHGRGVAVSPDKNPQLLYYATGAALRFHNRGLKKLTLAIVQPRCGKEAERIRQWSTSPVDLLDWRADLVQAAEKAEDPMAPLAPGTWCKKSFCPAAGTCPAYREHCLKIAQIEFDDNELKFVQPDSLSPAQLSTLLSNLDLVEDFIKRTREHAHELVSSGKQVPGWKLVWKRAVRKWLSEGDALKTLAARTRLKPDQFIKPKILTPAQVETELKKVLNFSKQEAQQIIDDLVSKESSGTTLVPEDDSRPAAQRSALEDFI